MEKSATEEIADQRTEAHGISTQSGEYATITRAADRRATA